MSLNTIVLPLYSQYYSLNGKVPDNWQSFKNTNKEFTAPLSSRSVDFSVDNRTWVDQAKSIGELAVKIITVLYLFNLVGGSYLSKRVFQTLPINILQRSMVSNCLTQFQNIFGKLLSEALMQKVNIFFKTLIFIAAFRHTLQRIIMIPLYPAQSRIIKFFFSSLATEKLNAIRKQIAMSRDFICRDVVIEKNGVRYSGMLMGHKSTINNGNWALQATGNAEPIEVTIQAASAIYHKMGFNTLMVNGPSVGKSKGRATPDSMGNAQDVGLSFLEEALKAKKIVIAGRSLGGASIGQAILKHHFKLKIRYLVVRQMSFDKTSSICGKLIGQISTNYLGWIVTKMVQFAGYEMDSVAASKKLQQLEIKEVIVQASRRSIKEGELPHLEDFQTDGPIIANAGLGYALIQQGIIRNKFFYCLPNADHMTNKAISIAESEIRKL